MLPCTALKSATFAILLFCISASEMGTTSKILNNDIWQEIESCLEPRESEKLKSTCHGLRKLKITGIVDMFPNNSKMKMYITVWNNEIIWENDWLADHRMRAVEQFSLAERGRDSSNRLLYDISGWRSDPVLDAEAKEFGKALLLAMSEHVDVDARGYDGTTPLMEASRFGADEAILKLIGRGADVEDSEPGTLNRWRAIHFAAEAGSERCAQALLENKANVDAEDVRGATALFVAARKRHPEVLKVLLNFHANSQIRSLGLLPRDTGSRDCREAIEAYEELNN